MFVKFLKTKLMYFLLYMTFMIIFSIVSLFGYMSLYVIGYVILLCSIIFIIYLLIDYYMFMNKYRTLQHMKSHICSSLENLPQSKNMIETQYQELLHILYQSYHDLETKKTQSYNDMLEYYTMWVHQIKTPISALKLLLQSKENSQDMLLEVIKIEQYVNMVLHYLKLEDMHQDLLFKKISLDHMVSKVVKKHVLFFSHSKVNFVYDIDETYVLTDEKWSSFVIEQILSNAIKYTYTGTIKIYNEKDKLYIEDTGIGIKSEDLPRIMEKGYTGYNGRQDKKASGIGLYLSKSILDYLGHDISIESTVGVGTRVCIDFYSKEMIFE